MILFYIFIICLYCFTDNSERAFYKELVKVIELSDVILEVLDARDPLGTRCTDMERMVMQAGPNKHLVLLLNKIGKAFSIEIFSALVLLLSFRLIIISLYYRSCSSRGC